MSLVITLWVREGIVMAADSRLTLNQKRPSTAEGAMLSLSVAQTDSTNKLFRLGATQIGISTVGAADVAGTPIGGYMQEFENSLSGAQDLSVEQVAGRLLEYFRGLPGPPSIVFYAAGYYRIQEQLVQQVWQVSVSENNVRQLNVALPQGAAWNRESDAMVRLLNPVWVKADDGQYS